MKFTPSTSLPGTTSLPGAVSPPVAAKTGQAPARLPTSVAPVPLIGPKAPARVVTTAHIRSKGGDSDQLFYGALDTAIGFLPGANLAQTAFNYVVVPMLLGGRPLVIKGRVAAINAAAQQILGAASTIGSAVNLVGYQFPTDLFIQHATYTLAASLPGAYVVLHQVSVPSIGLPGRLQAGMIYATSQQDGSFLLLAPSLTDLYLVTATHPQFQDQVTLPVVPLFNLSLAGVVFQDFLFETPLVFETPPAVNVANEPLNPAPGGTCLVQVNASPGIQAAAPIISMHVVRRASPTPRA